MHSRQVKPEQLSSVQCRIVCPCWGKLLSALRLEMYPMLIKNVVEVVGLGLNDTNIIIHKKLIQTILFISSYALGECMVF